MKDAQQKGRLRWRPDRATPEIMTHCKRGHEFTPDNTYYTTGGNGVRQCKACHKLREREKHRRKLGAAVAGWYEAAPLVAAINTYMDAHETPNTYAAIGRLLGVHGDTVRGWLAEGRAVRADTAQRACSALGITPASLWSDYGDGIAA